MMFWVFILRLNGVVVAGKAGVTINATTVLRHQEEGRL
jgi:hypothetical protein